MRKKILSLLLVITMTVSLVACGKGNDGVSKGKNNPKEIMSAFSEYYVEYSDEHYRKDIEQYEIDYLTSEHWDCIGKMIYFDNQPMMMIADLVGTSSTSEDFIYNIHIFAYEKGEIVEKYTVKDLITWDDGFTYFVDDNAVLIKTYAYAFDDNYEGAIYELKDGEVKAYTICKGDENTEGEELYYADYLDEDDKPVEVDDTVKHSYYLNPRPYNYFLSDCEETLTENKYFGALTQEDFVSFLDKLAELESIDSEAQLEEMYCEFMGYSYSGTINDAINVESNIDGFYVDNEFYAFSKEEGVENLKDMPTSVNKVSFSGEGRQKEITGITYNKTNGLQLTGDVLESEDAGCIIGVASTKMLDGEKVERVSLSEPYGVPTILSIAAAKTSTGIPCQRISYSSYKNKEQYIEYGCLRLNFIDGYKIAGLTKDSTEEDIINAGYQPTYCQHVYYNIYSEMPIDYDNIQKDYDTLYFSGLTQADVMDGELGEYIDYWDEYMGGYYLVRGQLSGVKLFDYTINSENEKRYEEMASDQLNSYADEVKMHLAIASQMYLLNTGKIDYFVISQIDATDGTNDWQFSNILQGYREFGYDDNTLSLYIISSVEDYENWLKQAGWTE